jgi:peptidoglycan/xylan/chitin deacetylase (PgdA/CDA1 family)
VSRASLSISEIRQTAADHVARYRLDPATLATLPLGRFSDAGVRSLLLRRLLLRVSPVARVLEWLAATSPRALPARARELAAESAYWRAARAHLSSEEWLSLTHGPVVLMYHAIGANREKASRYIIRERQFERQVSWLRRRGYRLMTLRQIAEARARGLAPGRAVALTFDDGYSDNAQPLLTSGVPATFFAVTGCVGGSNAWDAEGALRGRKLLGWDELRSLRAAGIEIGGHSRSHPSLPDLTPQHLVEEIHGSLADLRRELGPGDYTFAYPHGRFNVEVRQTVAGSANQETRYVAAACSRGGVNDPFVPAHELRRVEIKGTDSFLSFILMVALGRRITPGQFLRSVLFG